MDLSLKKKNEDLVALCIKAFVFISLFIPISFAKESSSYYAELAIANVFAVAFIVLLIFNRNISKIYNNFTVILIMLLILYNVVSLYANLMVSKWFWHQINMSLAVLIMIVLISCTNMEFFKYHKILEFIIRCIVLTTLLGIIVYFIGFTAVSLMIGYIAPIWHDPTYYEMRFSWVYFHKSQYCFILLLFLALILKNTNLFKNKISLGFAIIVVLVGMIISHLYTAVGAAAVILICYGIDYVKKQYKKIKAIHIIIPIIIAIPLAILFLIKMSKERSIWTLGGRTYIWRESIAQILDNPFGIGNEFPKDIIIPELSFYAGNCHNVFLNEMWRYSIPVGIVFILIIATILIYSLVKELSFLNIGIWIGLMISLNMDYALLERELTITFFMLYLIFVLPYMGQNCDKKTNIYKNYIKRILDIAISIIAGILLIGIYIIVAILVKIKLGSPVLFKQERPGLNENIFILYKFRTMTDEKDEAGNLKADEERLTKFGKMLRATSLDELPELINVIKGDMSLVGPRPLLVRYLPLYNEYQKKRHDVRPGITGYAQVSGRNSISWEDKFNLDVEYVNNVSFLLDLKIIIKTITTVLKKEGITSQTSETMEEFKGNV